VPSHSAILPGYIPIGIRNNHMDMTKFDDANDPGFIAVAGELRRWSKELKAPTQNVAPNQGLAGGLYRGMPTAGYDRSATNLQNHPLANISVPASPARFYSISLKPLQVTKKPSFSLPSGRAIPQRYDA